MIRTEILTEIKMYFDIRELVGKGTYKKHGERACKFLDTDLLHCLLVVRKTLNKPITINTWHIGGRFSQRGLRTTLQQLVRRAVFKSRLYLSAHLFGKAIDFDVKGMTANEVREWLVINQHLLPCKIRLERKLKGKFINWVHLDVFHEDKNNKVKLFDV